MKSRAPSSAVSSVGAQGGAQREEEVWGPPRGEAGGRDCTSTAGAPCRPLHCRQQPPGTAEDRPGAGASRAQRPGTPRQDCAWLTPIPTALAPRPGQAASQPLPDTARGVCTHTTHMRTQRALGHVTGCITRGHHHNWTRDFCLCLWPSVCGGLHRGSFLQGGTRVPGAGSVASTGVCDSAEETVLRKAELCLKSEPTGNALQA